MNAADRPGADLEVRSLDGTHDRKSFLCGTASLDKYLKTQAGQDVRRRVSGVFVLVEPAAPTQILGFYTLSAVGLAPGDIPEAARSRLPRYPQVSATLIGRLAAGSSQQGQGLGAVLLIDAMRRCYASAATVGSSMIVVDAIDERAAAFYEAFNFLPLADASRLIFPMHQVGEML